jgi:hypothetical protein
MQRKHVSKRNDFINLTNTANFPVCIKLNDERKKIISTLCFNLSSLIISRRNSWTVTLIMFVFNSISSFIMIQNISTFWVEILVCNSNAFCKLALYVNLMTN